MNNKTIIVGTIGSDIHLVGQYVIWLSLKDAGFNAISLGSMVGQEEFINAAIETKADAIFISSLYGMGLFDCAGLRDKCTEAGLKDILLYLGGQLTIDPNISWEEITQTFQEMGYNQVCPQTTLPGEVIAHLEEDLGIKS